MTTTTDETVALKPWPYREESDPLPVFCARCGRTLLPYAWGDHQPYLELACAGRLQWVFRRVFRGGLFAVRGRSTT